MARESHLQKNGRLNPYATHRLIQKDNVLSSSWIIHAFHVKSLASKQKNVLANGDSSFIMSVEGCAGLVNTT